MSESTVFIVTDDPGTRDSLKDLLKGAGLQAEIFSSLQTFLQVMALDKRGCLVLDAHSGYPASPNQRREFADCCARMSLIVLTERGDVEMAVRVMKLGAADVVQKPYWDSHWLGSINKALAPTRP